MIDFFLSHLIWFWLFIFIVCVVIETFTFSLTTIWGAVSALFMIIISRTQIPFQWQLIVFLVLTILLVIFTRPFAVKKLKLGKEKTNVDSLLGQEVIVISEIKEFSKGQVKTKNGVIWSAESSFAPVAEGAKCLIEKINGNTLEVSPVSD